MKLPELNIKHSYISYGEDNIAKSLINPALAVAKNYKRSVGYFSSSAFSVLVDGIVSMVRNGGTIQLIASPQLSESDIKAINSGYDIRKKLAIAAFDKEFSAAIEELDDDHLKMLFELVSKEYMDIKIAVTKGLGIYHDKLGIIEDNDGNVIAFYGSANASYNGYCENYEKIRVSRSWISGESEAVFDELTEFNNLWSNLNPFVDVIEYTESAKRNILKTSNHRRSSKKDRSGIKLRDYQEEAISAWIENGYHGFYVMATGTGKTWTAIYSAKALMEKERVMLVICAPYKHLIKQWAEDINKVFPDASVILVSSENQSWEKDLTNSIIKQKYAKESQIIVITTITSFYLKRFLSTIIKSDQKKLLIVDEAHRFTKHPEMLNRLFQYTLGLSATPFSGKCTQSGNELMGFFGGQIFNLPLEKALEKGFLVPYYYHPIYVQSTYDEEMRFRSYTQKIASCYQNGVLINKELLVKSLRGRLRVISMAEEKQERIKQIISPLKGKDHFVVYCGDGKLFNNDTGEELRHIQAIKKVLSEEDFRVSQFTAKESMSERMQLVDSFNKGDISALAAIRCLDEGINIPSIKSALILSSNDDYREFVQRRGRILRTYKNKDYADIYDVVVLPSKSMDGWATIEFRRYYEYAKLALNKDILLKEMKDRINYYGVRLEDIRTFEYEDFEVNEDD